MNTIRIPAGTRDMLPPEAAEMRRLEGAIRDAFAGFGYGEVITPTLELESAIGIAGERRFQRSFRLFDEQGEILMLRQEMTTPIARLVATRMGDREAPIRLCYFANAFRPTTPQRGRQSEFRQAGLELIGEDSAAIDGEVLAVLCTALEACGLKSFSIGLGEASFLGALLDATGVSDEERQELMDTLADRDMVEFARVVSGLDIDPDDRQAIADAVALRGGSDVLTRARDLVRGPAMEEALRRLARTYYIVSRYGHAGRLLFDFGIMRDFDYYTGIVFEVLSSGIGFPIGGGGRYNNLLGRFGRPAPAVGFALGLDRLHIATTGRESTPDKPMRGLVLAGGLDEELELARELRAAGIPVFAVSAGTGNAEARAAAVAAGFAMVALPHGDAYDLIDAKGGSSRVSRDELAAALGVS